MENLAGEGVEMEQTSMILGTFFHFILYRLYSK